MLKSVETVPSDNGRWLGQVVQTSDAVQVMGLFCEPQEPQLGYVGGTASLLELIRSPASTCLQMIGLNLQPCNSDVFIRQVLFQRYLSNDEITFPVQAPVGRKTPGSGIVQFVGSPIEVDDDAFLSIPSVCARRKALLCSSQWKG
jgi:hypothetical protein